MQRRSRPAMNGGNRATDGRIYAPTWHAVVALLAVTPVVALTLDPDPQRLPSEWQSSLRSTLALLAFTLTNATVIRAICSMALRRAAPTRVGTGLLICCLCAVSATPVVCWLPIWPHLDARLFAEPIVFGVRALVVSLVWVILACLASSVWAPRAQRALLAQVRASQSQLEAHFLFNALDSLAQLVSSDAAIAEAMLVRFSHLLRELVVLAETPMIPLSRELSLVRSYVEVAKMRYPDLVYEVEGEPLAAMLPPGSLHQLIENAVLHGAAPIRVVAREDSGHLTIAVRNALGRGKPHSTNTGLHNVRERLTLVCGRGATLWTQRTQQDFTVEVRVPWIGC